MKKVGIILWITLLFLILTGCGDNLTPNDALQTPNEIPSTVNSGTSAPNSAGNVTKLAPNQIIQTEGKAESEMFSLELPIGWVFDNTGTYPKIGYAPDLDFNVFDDPYWKINFYLTAEDFTSSSAKDSVTKKMESIDGTEPTEIDLQGYKVYLTQYYLFEGSKNLNCFLLGVSEPETAEDGTVYRYVFDLELFNCPPELYENALAILDQLELHLSYTPNP